MGVCEGLRAVTVRTDQELMEQPGRTEAVVSWRETDQKIMIRGKSC